jgi:hypothetical protein
MKIKQEKIEIKVNIFFLEENEDVLSEINKAINKKTFTVIVKNKVYHVAGHGMLKDLDNLKDALLDIKFLTNALL